MILATIAVAGFLTGVAGLSIGLMARHRVERAVEDCADVLRRQLQVTTGSVDNKTLRDIAIVHYDALREMSGERSFSLALLNSVGDGVVLSSINGRTETRTYAKVVMNGHGVEVLSPEEDQAVRAARLGKGPVVRMEDPLPDFGHRSASVSYTLERPLDRGSARSGAYEPAEDARPADGGQSGADGADGAGKSAGKNAEKGAENGGEGGAARTRKGDGDTTGTDAPGSGSTAKSTRARKSSSEPEVKPDAKDDKPGTQPDTEPTAKPDDAKPDAEQGGKAQAKPEAKVQAKPNGGGGGGGGATSAGSKNGRRARSGGQRQRTTAGRNGGASGKNGGASDKNGRRSGTAQSDGKAADAESGPGGASARR